MRTDGQTDVENLIDTLLQPLIVNPPETKSQLLRAVQKTGISDPSQTMRNVNVFFLPRYELLKSRNHKNTVHQ
jgi:hypothetical protein